MAYKYKGRMYDTKADMQAAKAAEANSPLAKAKKKFGFFSKEAKEERIRARNAKKPANKSIEQGKRNTAATSKMYAAESMFKSAENKDKAKSMSGKAQPFGSAFKSAKASGKKVFLWKGKSYTTQTKSELEAGSKMGKFKNRFDQTGKDEPKKKESIFSKFKKKLKNNK
tara:strand:+ start:80 stop:586 length:507 start_codon:yes stop_codon:yes gene_type:complete